MTTPALRDDNHNYTFTAPDGTEIHARSVTTLNREGLPTPFGIRQWDRNEHIDPAYKLGTERPDLDTAEVRRTVKAEAAGRMKTATDKGTAVHAVAERLLRGEPLHQWDQIHAGEVEALTSFLADSKFTALRIEQTVANLAPLYAGTYDALGNLDGALALIDWKTGSPRGAFSDKSAMQLAAYALASHLANPDGTLVARDYLVQAVAVVHLAGTGKYEVKRYEGAALSDLFAHWLHVYAIAQVERDGLPGGWGLLDLVGIPAYREELRTRVGQIIEWGGGDELAAAWPADIPTLKHDGHTTGQLDAIEFLLRRIEPTWQPKPAPASAERHSDAIETLRGLSESAFAVIEKYAASAEIPNLKGGQATDADLDQLDRIIVAVCRAPDSEDRAARIGRATNGRTTNPAELTAEDMEAFMRTRKSRAVAA